MIAAFDRGGAAFNDKLGHPRISKAVINQLALCCNGCIGPAGIRLTRPHYNETVKRTGEQELLLNLVRLRYDDAPYYIRVSAITAQFTGDSRAILDAEADAGLGTRYFGNGEIGFTDRPTISYTPQTGADFAQTLLKPLSLETVVLLAESNWSHDRVLRTTLEQMNGVENAASAGGPTPEVAPEYIAFRQAAALINDLHDRRWVSIVAREEPTVITSVATNAEPTVQDAVLAAKEGFQLAVQDNDVGVMKRQRKLFLGINPQVLNAPEITQLCQLLRLQQGVTEYPLSSAAGTDFEALNAPFGVARVDVKTRSLADIMFFLATGVTVPEEHFARGIAVATRDTAGRWFDWQNVVGELFHLRVCKCRPKDKLRVKYRGYWYYVADDDESSKRTLLLLLNILELQNVETQPQTPLLTIPI